MQNSKSEDKDKGEDEDIFSKLILVGALVGLAVVIGLVAYRALIFPWVFAESDPNRELPSAE